MKKILITGADSYIGTSFEQYMKKYDGYEIDTVDMIDGSWREKDFSGYDVVFHVAGIVHVNIKNVSEEIRKKYYAVNTDLTMEIAKKAKESGIRQFVFMSSMSVFGTKQDCIDKNTIPQPDNFYGDSKLQADIGIHQLECEKFKVVSIRPPMIYGKGAKGNYPMLAKFAKVTPIFPNIDNKRSMLYIENLCEFVKLMIDNDENGYFYPQNREFVKTSDMVAQIAKVHGKQVKMTKVFNPVIWAFRKHPIIKKVFGNLYYAKNMSEYRDEYSAIDLKESIIRTEII